MLGNNVTEIGKPRRSIAPPSKEELAKMPKYGKCAHSHPGIKIADVKVYGGACADPVPQDCDIYVGLDRGMGHFPGMYPWHNQVSFLFYIQDMSVPKSIDEFRELIAYLSQAVVDQKKIHIGCIGGHGRTGLVLAALVRELMNLEDAVTYVRENYCKKAVESQQQIDWLFKHFDIMKVEPTKKTMGSKSKWKYDEWPSMGSSPQNGFIPLTRTQDISYVSASKNVWGKHAKRNK